MSENGERAEPCPHGCSVQHVCLSADSCAQEIYLLHLRAPAPAYLTEVQEAEGYGPQCRPARVVMEHALSCKLSTVQTFVQDIELSNAKVWCAHIC